MKSTEATNVSKLSNKEKTVASTVASDMSKSVASVRSWLKKNAAESSKTDIATVKEMLYQEVMETLNTRLVEINEATGEALQAAFLKDIEELDSLKQRIDALEKSKMDRVCALIRADAEHKKRMLQLLKEDIQRILK
ncbi:uncharacterized protein LOC125237865 [Leguminivora glycinivorella]|uniref:uncharacterized protein LOC125237865 n=1 Tax=Leguminivora glycinivorella TaxID=1035111 RepID=UPI00200D2E4B|nr:uncharacterized protein LOC125237865 [Leguminivora glycinivorella]